MSNNHPVFGICCHHPLHPIGACTRIVALAGSFIFGLAMTNCFYLFYLWNPRFNQFVMYFGGYTLTTGMLLLWTVGGSLHTAYNLLMWHIAACACCRTGGCWESNAWCPSFGKHLLRYFVVISLGLAFMIILLRVAITNTDAVPYDDDDVDVDSSTRKYQFAPEDEWNIHVDNAHEFQFVLGYLVEMILALFVYYPIGCTILFSGVLGCGKVPLLGGRPAEVAAEERRHKKNELRLNPTESTLELPAEERRQKRNELRELRLSSMKRTFGEVRLNSQSTLASTTSTAEEAEEGDLTPVVAKEQDIELVWTPGAVYEYFEDRVCEV
jgi:hypothetical protein